MTEKGNKKAGTKAIEPLLEVIDCKKGSRVLPKKMKQVSCCPCRCDKHRLAFYHVLFLVEWLALLHLCTHHPLPPQARPPAVSCLFCCWRSLLQTGCGFSHAGPVSEDSC